MKKVFQNFKHALMLLDLSPILLLGYRAKSPQRQLILGYSVYALLGTLLLMFPFFSERGISWHDHLFTAVSALSTTGLATVNIGSDYHFSGQLVILFLVQLGGLGYMTFSSYMVLGATHRINRDESNMVNTQFALPENMQREGIVRNIVRFTFSFELLGVLLLYPYFKLHDMAQPLWSAIFHSVSTFCTAGFSLYADNMMSFRSDVYVNMVLMLLSYMGAMGFIFMTDVSRKIMNRKYRFSFTTRLIFVFTLFLPLLCAAHLYWLEPELQQYSSGERFMVALFQSMSAMTTTGFNTIDLTHLVPISLMVMSVTMYIGASPAGTGGGLKSTTIATLFAYTRSKLKMQHEVTLMNHTIPNYRVDTAISSFIFYTCILLAGVYGMTLFEPNSTDVQQILFEGASALATTGLTSGALVEFTLGSQLILIVLMFIGRIGVVTLGNAVFINSFMDHSKKSREDLAV